MKKIYSLAAVTLVILSLQAQKSQDNCATMDVLQQQLADNPVQQATMDQVEADIQHWIANNQHQRGGNIITIPVVIHIVHNGQSVGTGPNITAAQAISQIDVVNEDFRRMNADTTNTLAQFVGVAADTEIEFCLATVDPQGQPTTGLNRVDGGQGSWSINDIESTLKPSTIWNRNHYLNMWSVNFTSGGLLGYAQFPGGPANTDGVVVGYQYFGLAGGGFSGRTMTHEVGHWLNLRHIWGDGGCGASDFVGDTPDSDNPNYGCPLSHTSCSTLDMVQNYMDYSNDNCMNLFTQGQKTRMRAALNTTRVSITTSPACTPLSSFAFTGQVVDSVTGQGIPFAEVLFDGTIFDIPATCDASGNFTIATFYEDTYDVYGAAWGWQTKELASTFIDSVTGPLTIAIDSGYYDDYILDLGWTENSTASTGDWVRGNPIGTSFSTSQVNPGDDISTDYGLNCYMTGNGGGAAGNDDVDNGVVTLTSPVMDLTSYADPYVSFYRWFQNDGGSGTPNDELLITITNGSATDTLELVDVNDPNLGSWVFRDYKITDHVSLTNNMQISLRTSDLQGSGHLVEAAIDVFKVRDSIVGTQPPQALFTATPLTICEGETIAFTDQSTNGPNVLSWTFPGGSPTTSGAASPTVTYNNAGTYDVTLIVSNLGGSDTLTQTLYVTVLDRPNLTINGMNAACNGDSSGTATANVTGGTAPFAYNWSNSATTESITNLSSGFYSVTVTDANGCTASSTVNISQPPAITSSSSSTNENGTLQDGTATVVPSGGVPGYTYLWSDALSQTTQTATGLGAGLYFVTVTDANGCEHTAQAIVDRTPLTGIPSLIETVSVSPNPSTGRFLVNWEGNGEMHIDVHNVIGQQVWASAHKVSATVNLSNQPNGVYIMTLSDGSRSSSLRLEVIR